MRGIEDGEQNIGSRCGLDPATGAALDATAALETPSGARKLSVSLAPIERDIATFLDVVFSYCDGLIPVRSYAEKGLSGHQAPATAWLPADKSAAQSVHQFAAGAARDGRAVYVIPGTVAAHGQARAADVQQMQAIVVDLDTGDIGAKLDHLVRHLGRPTLLVESGGQTEQGIPKVHAWWRLSEPVAGADVDRLCALRGAIAEKVGGDLHFRSPHQPIRVAGTVYQKNGAMRLTAIWEHNPLVELDLDECARRVALMPGMPGESASTVDRPKGSKPLLSDVLVTPVRENGQDNWTRFEGASAAIGHYVRQIHEGRLSAEDGWEAVVQYNAAMLRPPWPVQRLRTEFDRITRRHIERYGADKAAPEKMQAQPASLRAFRLGTLLDDCSPMPEDLMAPRLLTPGGMLVLGGAPKVGKSDLLIHLLVHAAAGLPFLCFTPPRPLRVFYLQAEIQYHYLRERLQALPLARDVLHQARDNLVVTPKLNLILDDKGLPLVEATLQELFPTQPPDIICLDPIRNLFDSGMEEGGENSSAAMLFFLQSRVEALRAKTAPDSCIILCHHTKKVGKNQMIEDPFQALAGSGALRGFYSSGIIMHRPDEARPERQLEIELRNGAPIGPLIITKQKGNWVQLDSRGQRLVHRVMGTRLDAERVRKREVILRLLYDEARAGRLYTINQFAELFENTAGLGGKDTIRTRVDVLATKGWIKFVRNHADLGLTPTKSKFGYLCVEGMQAPLPNGEPGGAVTAVLPTHFKNAQTGMLEPVDDTHSWDYVDQDDGL
ncbi:MAG: AAA family ATPase [Acetobacteraceae bacterium]